MVTLLVAAAFLVVAELAARRIAPDLPPPDRWYVATASLHARDLDEIDRVDTLAVGSSLMLHGFRSSRVCDGDPSVAYNSATQAAFPRVWERLVDDLVLDRVQPRRILWEVSPVGLSDNQLDTETLKSHLNTPAGKGGVLAATDRAAARRSVLVDSRRELRRPSQVVSAVRGAEPDVTLTERVHPCGDKLVYRPLRLTGAGREFEIHEPSVDAVIAGVLSAERQGSQVVLVDMPLVSTLRAAITDEQAARYMAAIDRILDETDASLVMPSATFADSDFADETHLNAAGADKFTSDIASQLGMTFEPAALAVGRLPEAVGDDAKVCVLDAQRRWLAEVAPTDRSFSIPLEPGSYRFGAPCDSPDDGKGLDAGGEAVQLDAGVDSPVEVELTTGE